MTDLAVTSSGGRGWKVMEPTDNPDKSQRNPITYILDQYQVPRAARSAKSPFSGSFGSVASLYLIAIALAEVTTVLIDTRWGIIGHGLILTLLMAHASVLSYQVGDDLEYRPMMRDSDEEVPALWTAHQIKLGGRLHNVLTVGQEPSDEAEEGHRQALIGWYKTEIRSEERRQAHFLSALALVPLIRIVSLAMPLDKFPIWSWYGVIAVPLLAAAWVAARAAGYSAGELGLRLELRPAALLLSTCVSVSGVILGYLEYQILKPKPFIENPTLFLFVVVSLTLLIGTGFMEELIFRGILQVACGDLFGDAAGILLPSTLFAVLHVGQHSALDVIFVFVVAIGFALIVKFSRSIVGVTLAHGLTNIFLFIVFPHLLGKTG